MSSTENKDIPKPSWVRNWGRKWFPGAILFCAKGFDSSRKGCWMCEHGMFVLPYKCRKQQYRKLAMRNDIDYFWTKDSGLMPKVVVDHGFITGNYENARRQVLNAN